ncbi:MAG: hypothetical protein AABN34_22140 [Acidobacteriota bacterium]
MNWATIRYRDFYDVPRIFITALDGQEYLFDCPFDDDLDDYSDHYRVYQLPAILESELEGSWELLPEQAERLLAAVPVAEVQFDSTKRQRINTTVIEALLARRDPQTTRVA